MSKTGTEIASEAGEVSQDENRKPERVGDNLLAFDTPEVTEQAGDFIEPETPAEPQRATEPTLEDYRGQLDDKGNAFDPLIHDYPPTQTPTGRWKKRPKNKPAPELPPGQDELLANAKYRAEAEKMALLYGNLHRIPFGENGKIEPQAISPLIDDIERYMMENGHTQISPKWAVLLSASMYSLTICQRPTNKEKVLKWLSPVTGYIKNLFGFKSKKAEKIKQSNEPNITSGGKPQPVKTEKGAIPQTDESAVKY